jgi:hypothetical protein
LQNEIAAKWEWEILICRTDYLSGLKCITFGTIQGFFSRLSLMSGAEAQVKLKGK